MSIHLAICALIAGCGYPPLPVIGLDDAATDGPGNGTTDCFSHWFDHTVSISAIEELVSLSSAGSERNPWISADGLRLYFDRMPGSVGETDIYFTSRNSTADAFTEAQVLIKLDTTSTDFHASLTSDELTLAMASNYSGPQNIYMTTRARRDEFGTPNSNHLTQVNAAGTSRGGPFLSSDGLRLYFNANSGPEGHVELRVSERPNAAADFTQSSSIPGINNPSADTPDVALSLDERIIVFSVGQGAFNGDLFYATRSSRTDNFGAGIRIPRVNDVGKNGDPLLNADGCQLYFASDRRDDRFHLFRAQVVP